MSSTNRWLRQFGGPPLGRDEIVRRLADRLRTPSRSIVTVTGEGGVGKTRVAVAAVDRVIESDPLVRVLVVDLADERDPGAVPAAIATALDLDAHHDTALVTALSSERTIVVLDPFEHLVAAAPALADLLAQCPPLSIVAVSRAPLRVRDERVLAVDPFPAGSDHAVALFRRSARSARATIDLDDELVRQVCDEVGGLPLAIELAAARSRLLGPAALLEQLRTRSALAVLSGGGADLPPRQRGLPATLAWSHALLGDHERRVLDAACATHVWLELDELIGLCEHATGLDRTAVIGALDGLEAQHFLDVDHASTLARVRPTAREFVTSRGEPPVDALRHVTTDFARRAIGGCLTGERLRWLGAIQRRRDDLVSTLHLALADGHADDVAALALALCREWHRHPDPRRDDLVRRSIDALPDHTADLVRLLAWQELFRGWSVGDRDERTGAGARFDALVERAVVMGDAACVVDVCELSTTAALYTLHFPDAVRHAAIGRDHAAAIADHRAMGVFDLDIAMMRHLVGDLHAAARLARAALASAQLVDDRRTIAYAEMLLVHLPRVVVLASGPVPSITATIDQARTDGDTHVLVHLLPTRAFERLGAGDAAGAARDAADGLQIAARLGLRGEVDVALVHLSLAAEASGDLHAAAVLRGMVDARLPALRHTFPARFADVVDASLVTLRSRLGDAAVDLAMGAGATMRAAEAHSFALDVATRHGTPAPAPPHPLTRKELEVVRSLVRGHTNREIANELHITEKTAMHHLTNIFRKIGVRNRSEAVRWAFSNGLVDDASSGAAAGG